MAANFALHIAVRSLYVTDCFRPLSFFSATLLAYIAYVIRGLVIVCADGFHDCLHEWRIILLYRFVASSW